MGFLKKTHYWTPKIQDGGRITSAILKIVLRRILFFVLAVWASASGDFRVVFDTLVCILR